MNKCVTVTKNMLPNPIELHLDGEPLDFLTAKSIADEKVREKISAPMLLAWFDRKSGKFSPDVICCGDEKPSWLVYAESRGGGVSVNINNEEYVFVYRSLDSLD